MGTALAGKSRGDGVVATADVSILVVASGGKW